MQKRERKVGVLLGGLSSERDVSLSSGGAVASALRSRGHDVVEIDVGRDLPEQLRTLGVEVAVVMLHGTFGEDGCVQGLLEMMGIPYSGSGVAASALTMDKVRTKRLLAADGLPVADDIVLTPDEVAEQPPGPPFGLPLVVKPAAEGSSVGTTIVREADQWLAALAEAARWGQVLVEAFHPGPELTCSMLDGEALPLVEIRPRDGFYDYRNKYTKGCTEYLCPAPVAESTTRQVQQLAERTVAVCGVEGVARVDFMMGGGDDPVILEVNTIPGMTELSLVPMAAREVGLEFADVAERILDGARLRLAEAE